MRITRTFLGPGIAAAILVSGAPARAQSWAGATWVPLARSGANVQSSAGGTGYLDVVGDGSNAAAFVASDLYYLYLRVRVNGDPTDTSGTKIRDDVWGCFVDSDGALTRYEYFASFDATGATDVVSWRKNTTPSADGPLDAAETTLVVSPASSAGRWEATSDPDVGGGAADWFVDLAVPWTSIRPAIAVGRSLRFVCGTSATAGVLDTDTFAGAGAMLSTQWSDGVVCGDSGCVRDRDQDDVPDSVETALGSDPTKADSDGDGLSDGVELSATSGTAPFSAIDTDGDGVMDALDADSDNDCVPDSMETAATFRDASKPNTNPSSVCKAPTPICSPKTGTCTSCDASYGATGNAPCPTATAPACQTFGALSGQCTECKVGETQRCTTTEKPACEVSTGQCSPCNGPNGGLQTATCPDPSKAACHTVYDDLLLGECTQCTLTSTGSCTGATPACDVGTGTCQACNGDRGGGGTRACPSTDAPTCVPSSGTCIECKSDADCGVGHTGPTCDTVLGQCTDKDTDLDTLNDSVENLLGTDPNVPDTDGDGIKDAVEVTPTGGGATTKVDTDHDGTIDARDTDSDDDGALDADEKTDDADADGIANYRDKDDDDDDIDTKTEVADTKAAKVGDDVDGDGKKNWYDDDANGNGKSDSVDGRGDADGDGIPDYLDTMNNPPGMDAGGSSTSSSGAVVPPDAGAHPPDAGEDAAPSESGVIEGNGCLCGRPPGSSTGAHWSVLLGAVALLALGRRRRSRRVRRR